MSTPALKSLVVQAIALLGAGAAFYVMPPMPLVGWALIQGVLAMGLSVCLRQARWWWPMHALFMPAAVVGSGLAIAPGWFLALFVMLALCYWNSARGQVPLYLTNQTTASALAELLPAGAPVTLADVGCGTGSVMVTLARLRPDCRLIGLENAPVPWLIARLRLAGVSGCRVLRRDFWDYPLQDVQLVYAFLSPVPMARLWGKLCRDMPPGSLLISNSFEVPGLTPERIVQVEDARGTQLFCYRVPGTGQ